MTMQWLHQHICQRLGLARTVSLGNILNIDERLL